MIVKPVDPQRSRMMARVRNKNTEPEMLVRSTAHRLGYRFRLHRRDLPGSPDLVFPKWRSVVFVHGCFWHRHPGCRRATVPKTRTDFWSAKFAANILRDERAKADLEALGWRVAVIWECEIRSAGDLEALVEEAVAGPLHRERGRRGLVDRSVERLSTQHVT